jgi:hypothetical protein
MSAHRPTLLDEVFHGPTLLDEVVHGTEAHM